MKIKYADHKHGRLILSEAFPAEWKEIRGILRTTPFPLRAAAPFTNAGRPMTPKRHQKDKRRGLFALMPIDQNVLNKDLHARFKRKKWEPQPRVLGRTVGRELSSFHRGDFRKGSVFVEVEFGNTASLFRDLFKFQLVGQSKLGDVAVLIVATAKAARLMDSNVATFETVVRLLPFLDLVVALPTVVIGVEPGDWRPIRTCYDKMKRVAQRNGVGCLTFAEASRTPNSDEKLEVTLAEDEQSS